jgi:hypothetical protein
MTAEIVIMNKEAVALAADSAVTVRSAEGHKVFTSANKVFALSKHEPVGIMVFGVAEFMGTPWETIIKSFRAELGKIRFDSLEGYNTAFLRFLTSDPQLASPDFQRRYVVDCAFHLFREIQEVYLSDVQEIIAKDGNIDAKRSQQAFTALLDDVERIITSGPMIPGHGKGAAQRLKGLYGAEISKTQQHFFGDYPVTRLQSDRLSRLVVKHLLYWPEQYTAHAAGVVIAGFGTSERFPSVVMSMVDGIAGNVLRCHRGDALGISPERPATVTPFAQREMVYAFMEGVDPDYQKAIEDDIWHILREYPKAILDQVPRLKPHVKAQIEAKLHAVSEEKYREALEKFQKYRKERFWMPTVQVVRMLPKDELATMAETLVALTSFRRKMSLETETVAGPVDVAVISKGDGLIWIKRKHYFQPELNPQFVSNYYRDHSNGEKESKSKRRR